METNENISSEEELLKLRNEGRINDEEYKELLSELHKPILENNNAGLSEHLNKRWYRHKNLAGIVSIIISLVGLILPLTLIIHPMPENVFFNWDFVICIEIVACTLGFVSWKTKLGKIGATISSIAIIVFIPFFHL